MLGMKHVDSESPSDVAHWLRSESANLWPALLGSLSLRRSRCIRENCAACQSGEQHQSYVLYRLDQSLPFGAFTMQSHSASAPPPLGPFSCDRKMKDRQLIWLKNFIKPRSGVPPANRVARPSRYRKSQATVLSAAARPSFEKQFSFGPLPVPSLPEPASNQPMQLA